jgi:hypothetical protein
MEDRELVALPTAFVSPECRLSDATIVSLRLFMEKWPDYYIRIVRSN